MNVFYVGLLLGLLLISVESARKVSWVEKIEKTTTKGPDGDLEVSGKALIPVDENGKEIEDLTEAEFDAAAADTKALENLTQMNPEQKPNEKTTWTYFRRNGGVVRQRPLRKKDLKAIASKPTQLPTPNSPKPDSATVKTEDISNKTEVIDISNNKNDTSTEQNDTNLDGKTGSANQRGKAVFALISMVIGIL